MGRLGRIKDWARETVFRARATAAVWSNPVVVRDLRVRMRGSRSYWHLALYLALLILLAVSGYHTATTTSGVRGPAASAYEIQSQLQMLYYFIFVTLAGLVCFIAPALTAASITTEKQRLTLDLLVTTPLTSSELLVGKLISSMAFLALLLVLSLPASALCVILGGATQADLFRVYMLLLMDGLVLSAIGLYYSATSKNSMNAIISTYVTVGGLLWFTSPVIGLALAASISGTGSGTGNAGLAVGALNPFFAVTFPGGTFDLVGLPVPMALLSALMAFLAIRLIVTGATYRMGSYGTDALGSLRRQLLFLTGLAAFLTAYGISYSGGGLVSMIVAPAGGVRLDLAALEYTMLGAAVVAGMCMPNLFTPDTPEDALPGTPIEGRYDMRRAFRPHHAGSLPYYHLWTLTLGGGMLAGLALAGALRMEAVVRILLTALYVSGLGYLGWCVARRMAATVAGVAGARALAFGVMVVLVAAPLMLMVLFKQFDHPQDSPFALVWVFYPIFQPRPEDASQALLVTTAVCYGVGTLICPFWRKLIPAGVRYWGVAEAKG